jgi:hypothetical protein
MKRFGRVLVFSTGFLLSLTLVFFLCVFVTYALAVWRQTITVGEEIPPSFPVVAFLEASKSTPYNVFLVWYEDLESFRATHPESIFVVPQAEAERNQKKVASSLSGERAVFQVERRSDGTQTFRVDAFEGSDVYNTGWYTARQDSIVPLRHRRYFGPSLGMAAFLISTPVSLLVNGAVWFLGVRWWRRRAAAATAGA